LHVDFGVYCLRRKLTLKRRLFEISSSRTSKEDHEAQHKSRHMMNMTPNGLGTEA
jgi:hypothetical protein